MSAKKKGLLVFPSRKNLNLKIKMNKLNSTIKKKEFISILKLFLDIFNLISKRRKRQIYILFLIMIINALLEIISISSIGPFLSTLSNPMSITNFTIINQLTDFFKIGNENILLFTLIIFCFCISITAVIRLLNIFLSARLAAAIGSDLSCKSMKQ